MKLTASSENNPRVRASLAVERIFSAGAFSNILLGTAINGGTFSARDRALFTALVYGTAERMRTLRHILGTLAAKPPQRLAADPSRNRPSRRPSRHRNTPIRRAGVRPNPPRQNNANPTPDGCTAGQKPRSRAKGPLRKPSPPDNVPKSATRPHRLRIRRPEHASQAATAETTTLSGGAVRAHDSSRAA